MKNILSLVLKILIFFLIQTTLFQEEEYWCYDSINDHMVMI